MGEATLVTPAAVRGTGLHKRYGRRSALAGVDLCVGRGEIYGLIGSDGAGKSSLMKAVAGVLSLEEGELDVLGTALDSEAAAESVKGQIGFMPQGLGLNLYSELTVEENVDFFARLRLVAPPVLVRRKDRLLGMTRLAAFRRRPMKHLSGGMKQKLGLVCTLIHEPELLVLDEPTTGVDPVSRRDFWTMLSELMRDGGLTALVSTAYLDEASCFDRVSLLHEGRCLASGDPSELRHLVPGTVVVVEAEPQTDALAALEADYPQVEALGTVLRAFVVGADPEQAVTRVRRTFEGITVRRVEPGEPELENAFVALLGGAPRAAVTPRSFAPRRALDVGEAVIDALALTRDFGDFRAVDGATFSVRQGEIFGLLGANGAGKTTVIKMLTGLLPPTSGRARVAGVDMSRAERTVKRRIGYMSQAFSLYADLTVAENLSLYAGVYGLSRAEAQERARDIFAMAGLAEHRDAMAGRLPMGMRQRLALGCALVHRPQVVFLDEPTSGVDPVGRRRFWDILFHLARRDRVAVLVTTHYMSEAEHCDRLALMFAGRIVADATPLALKREVEREAGRLLEVAADAPAKAVDRLRRDGLGDPVLFGRHVHVWSRDPGTDAARIRASLASAGIACRSVRPVPLSMDDVFIFRVRALEDATRAGVGA